MDVSEKIGKVVIQARQSLPLFCSLLSLILRWKCVKSLIVIKIVPQMNFEEEWGKLDTENSVKRQLWTKYI